MKRNRVLVATGLAVLFLPAARTARASERSENFQTYCVPCHGEDGTGNTEEGRKKGARNFTNAKWQATVDDKRLIHSVTKGHDKMPAFGKKLSEDEIKTLVKEVRSLAVTKN